MKTLGSQRTATYSDQTFEQKNMIVFLGFEQVLHDHILSWILPYFSLLHYCFVVKIKITEKINHNRIYVSKHFYLSVVNF